MFLLFFILIILLLFDFSFLHLHTMSNQVESAVLVEGVDNSITLLKKVVIVDEFFYEAGSCSYEGKPYPYEAGSYSEKNELYYFYGTHPKKNVSGYWRISYKSDSHEWQTDSYGRIADSIYFLNFKIGGLPEFRVRGQLVLGYEKFANVWDYLTKVTEEEFFFARNCIRYKDEGGDERISWEFNKFEGYHE